jgi:hypothetical protein
MLNPAKTVSSSAKNANHSYSTKNWILPLQMWIQPSKNGGGESTEIKRAATKLA